MIQFNCLIIFLIIISFIKCESPLEKLYQLVNESYMENVISNFTSLLEGYVYLDITKNPPNGFHEKIDLIEELKKINITTERPFYEFYRDIKRVISKVKDLHLQQIPNFNDFANYYACIPFSFYIDLDENNEYQLYMKNYLSCPPYADENITNFINRAINEKIKISLINNEDPFDFLQNIGTEYFRLKNEHSYFSAIMAYISTFPLYIVPLNEEELNINITLFDGQSQNISFFIFNLPNLQKNPNSINLGDSNLDWNYTSKEFKCRVDEINHMNVFYQNTFIFGDFKNIKELIYNCSKLFHENDYKIVGIESKNVGGAGFIGIYLEQLLQPKICTNKMLFSVRKSDLLKENFEEFKKNYLDFKTCKNPESYDK